MELKAQEGRSFGQLWPQLLEEVAPSLREVVGLEEAQVEALRGNEEDCTACCVLEYSVVSCNIVFVSRGFEQKTGYTSDKSLGKSFQLLEIKAAGLNKFVNEHEINYVSKFCELGPDAPRNASLVAFLLHERADGERFWDLVRLQYVSLGARQYIFCINGVLGLPLPTVIREARFLPDAQLDEAQFSCFLDALKAFLEQMRPHVHKQVPDGMEDLQDMVTKSLLSFMKGNTSEFEGDHWVPLLGQDRTRAFQQDVKWAGILTKVQNSLWKIWEVSERHDEIVACAVSDPTGDDCPLVYISREFEKLTGYQREWVLGRNCRFLQPNHSWRNAAFNKEECLRMRAFCKEPQLEHTRIVNLLVNERKDGYPFWNLVVMEHIEVKVNPKTSVGGVETRYYIFGVQTTLHFQLHRLSELLAMDTRGLIELRRLREVFRRQENSLHTQTLNAFAQDCISIWASDFPAALEFPRLQLCSMRGRTRTSMPIMGLEVNADNIMQTMPRALQDGVRHFYLTFPPSAHGDVRNVRMREMDVKILSLRLAQVLTGLGKTFLHYLRGAVSFSLVTPPQMVKHFGEISKAMTSHGYGINCWYFDVRGPDGKNPGSWKADECWQFMSDICFGGEVEALGLLGAGKELYESLQGLQNAAPVSAFGIEYFPGKKLSKYKYVRAQSSNGHVALVAFNVFGPKQALLELEELKDEAARHKADVALMLMKWCSCQVGALMVPTSILDRGRQPRRTRLAEFQSSPASFETGEVSQSRSGASMALDEPSQVEANVHRSLIKAFHRTKVVDGLEHLVANSLDARHVEVEGQARCRLPVMVEPSGGQGAAGDAAGSRLAGQAALQALPLLTPRRRSHSTLLGSNSLVSSPWTPRPPRSSTFDVSMPIEVQTQEQSKAAESSSTRRTSTDPVLIQQTPHSLLVASHASTPSDPPSIRRALLELEHAGGPQPCSIGEPQAAKPSAHDTAERSGDAACAATPPVGGGGPSGFTLTPAPPAHEQPAGRFRRTLHTQMGFGPGPRGQRCELGAHKADSDRAPEEAPHLQGILSSPSSGDGDGPEGGAQLPIWKKKAEVRLLIDQAAGG